MSGPSLGVILVVFVLVCLILESSGRTDGQALDSWNFMEPYVVMAMLMTVLTLVVYVELISEGVDFVHGILGKLFVRWE